MKVEKEKRKVHIFCNDGSYLKGVIHLNPGIRVSDFLNESRDNFIVLTNIEFFRSAPHSTTAEEAVTLKADTVLLNKIAIKMIEEA